MTDTESMYQRYLETREEPKVTIYSNDMKYKKYRGIDYSKYNLENTENMDTLEYRLKECIKTGGKELDISHLELEHIPKLPSIIVNSLTNLCCSDNNIEDLHDLRHFANLQVLDCANNKLTYLKRINLPRNLVEIICKNNEIVDISGIVKCENLTRLDCSNNKIESMPDHYNIEILDCSDNIINTIDMINLKTLICNNNKIKQLNKYKNLEKLHIFSNNIVKIPYYKNLEELICDYSNDLQISKKYKMIENDIGLDKTVMMLFDCMSSSEE